MPEGTADGYGDLHSHLVPGVDDGVRDLSEALAAIGRMVDAGIRHIVTTPHLDGTLTHTPEAFRARMDAMDRAWEAVRSAAVERWEGLEFRRGHELMLDTPDADVSDERLRLGGTSFVLVEWPRLHVPPHTADVVSRLRFAGVRPIIAHPERYYGIDRELAVVEGWRRAGAYLQVTHGSLVGRYGDSARTRAFRLLKRGWVDYLSTDYHGRPGRDLHLAEARRLVEKEGGDEQFDLLTRTNPIRLLGDEEPLPVPRLDLDGGFWARLRGIFTSGGV